MDNQFNQPGGYPPQYPMGQQPEGYAPSGYGAGMPQQPPYQPAANPYMTSQQPYVNPADPYGTGQQPYGNPADPYGTGQQPYGNPADPYGTGQQPYGNPADPYGTGQQPYGNPADPYGMGQQPYGNPANPYMTGQQQPVSPVDAYGTVQQAYQDPGSLQQPYSTEGYQHLFGQEGAQGQPVPPQPQAQPPRGKAFAGADAPQGPGASRRRMSGGTIAMIVVAMLAVCGFATWYLYASYAPEVARYGQVASGSLSAMHSGSCLVVRNEIPYDAEGVNSVVYEAKEGSRVVRKDLICQVYSSGYSASAVRQLQEYRDEIRDYQEQLMESTSISDSNIDNYNANILTLALEVRALMAGDEGSLPNIESQMTRQVAERQTYLDRKYADDQRFSRMKDDERSQTQRISSWTLPYSATTDALVSFYSDGYEYLLNGSNYANFEPDAVRAMIGGYKPEGAGPGKGKTTLYRMIKDNEWYALFLSNDTEWNPVVGESYELQLERFGDTPVTASVVSFTKSGGELLVRLRIVGAVEQVMYLRTCDAVLSEDVSTLMAHKRALHTQDGMTGVVVVEGSTESFIPVNVLHEKDGYVYFRTVQQGLLFEGMTVRLF